MQSIYHADPEKVIIGMVGRTEFVFQCPRGVNPTSARKSTATLTGSASLQKSLISGTSAANT